MGVDPRGSRDRKIRPRSADGTGRVRTVAGASGCGLRGGAGRPAAGEHRLGRHDSIRNRYTIRVNAITGLYIYTLDRRRRRARRDPGDPRRRRQTGVTGYRSNKQERSVQRARVTRSTRPDESFKLKLGSRLTGRCRGHCCSLHHNRTQRINEETQRHCTLLSVSPRLCHCLYIASTHLRWTHIACPAQPLHARAVVCTWIVVAHPGGVHPTPRRVASGCPLSTTAG